MSYRTTLLAVTVAALMWGLYWVPVHWLKATGVSGTVAAFMLVLGILPVIVWRVLRGQLALSRRHVGGALAIGIAISLYGAALNFTEVTRVVLLFYLAPAWSILIECKWFGRRLDRRTGLALLLFALGRCLYVLPVTVLTFLGAARLAPATVTFLLSAEILSGIASSSIWLGEPFTLAKVLGTVLIICGVMVEIRNGQQTA